MKNELITAAPPLGVTTLTFAGLPLQQWVYVVTIVYTVLLIISKLPIAVRAVESVYKKWREYREQSK